MSGRRRVAFAKINRRTTDQSLDPRPFADDIQALANSHETHAMFRGREWIAADLEVDASGSFMTGILGFADLEKLTSFEPQTFSWLKGEVKEIEGASERTMVPFAIDLREDRRWVAFATAQRIQPPGFAAGFAATLNAAVLKLGKMPSEWEVDLVLGKTRVESWLVDHPSVNKFIRIVRLHNPSTDIDSDRAEMRELAARTKREEYTAERNGTLRIQDNPTFEAKLEGLDTGDVDVVLIAHEGTTTVRFDSKRLADESYVDDFGDDLRAGMEIMLRAVREYSDSRDGGQQPTLTERFKSR